MKTILRWTVFYFQIYYQALAPFRSDHLYIPLTFFRGAVVSKAQVSSCQAGAGGNCFGIFKR
ncbi:MAG: hypothetical protein SGJ27_24945 [Candidatus Melainabacteria bacterium]|nr:hypothetical protein [Candidatus Melainabacteria bacterium]